MPAARSRRQTETDDCGQSTSNRVANPQFTIVDL